ncbi:LINE-1 retrotransposable element ORF1 protein [Labeo rohita]|uniref:LINE-1 retrotransposable element ORF1 protein n=1 Tax=Labeo rohita TaxID=84645 RepID=A0ABQ8MGN6_LABRO|nr:LINE-1 retrotransposable element ORF1 protein [Labeo rohita]
MEADRPNRGAAHSYTRKSLDVAFKENDAAKTSGSKIPLPETPKPPSKKSKMGDRDGSDSQSVSNSHLLEVLERVEKMQAEFLTRMQSLETTVKDNTNSLNSVTEALEFMNNQVEEVTDKVNSLQIKVESLEKENRVLRDKCDELDSYKRRWNLRVSGIQEQRGEDVRKILIDLFSKVSPVIADQLIYTLDVAHRLGPRSEGVRSSRRIIVQFLSRNVRDQIWRDARTAAVLKERKIRIFEDLTQSTKDARNKLWPLVEQASEAPSLISMVKESLLKISLCE